jgi:hypothetical protein
MIRKCIICGSGIGWGKSVWIEKIIFIKVVARKKRSIYKKIISLAGPACVPKTLFSLVSGVVHMAVAGHVRKMVGPSGLPGVGRTDASGVVAAVSVAKNTGGVMHHLWPTVHHVGAVATVEGMVMQWVPIPDLVAFQP